MLVNGDFSNGLSHWANWGNARVVSGGVQVGAAAGGIAQGFKVVPGGRYQLTGVANISAAAEGVFVGVGVANSAGQIVLNQSQLVSSRTAVNVLVTFTVPAGATDGSVFIWKNANAAFGIVDNLSVVRLS